MSALLAGLTVCLMLCGCEKKEGKPQEGPLSVKCDVQSLAMEAGQKAAIGVELSPSSATLSWDAPQGWDIASTGQDGHYDIAITAPEFTTTGQLVFTALNGEGEIATTSVDLECKGMDITPDPYSTPAAERCVCVTGFGKSQIAFNVSIGMGPDVVKYYYGVMTRKEADRNAYFVGENWKTEMRNSLIAQLGAMSIDHWVYKDNIYRHGGTSDPLEPNTEYYVYVVAQLQGGEYSELEMTRVITMPKLQRDPEIPTASAVAVSEIQIAFDSINATLSATTQARSYTYSLVDDSAISRYREWFGGKWDDGYIDMTAYMYTYIQPEKRIAGTHTYSWPNLQAGTTYKLLVLWFDAGDEPHLECTQITTAPKPAVAGSPSVGIAMKTITPSTVTYSFTPNGDCGSYTVDIWSRKDIDEFQAKYPGLWPQKLIEYAQKYGGLYSGNKTLTLDVNDFYPKAESQTRYWTEDTYMLVVMPFDVNGVYDDSAITYTHIKQ